MNICILGGDGYLGWPTAMRFSNRGHNVLLIDNFYKRRLEVSLNRRPLLPNIDLEDRINVWNSFNSNKIQFVECDISKEYDLLTRVLRDFVPDTIIHYAEQPSAPYSMISRETAIDTQRNNIIGTLNVIYAIKDKVPDCHLVKLGTMGEYGTPNIDIEEGWIDILHKGRTDRVLYPKKPHSIYHLSKVHDSNNLEFASRIWNIKITDLNQGVVYGNSTIEMEYDERLHTNFHYDDVFGTIINRFVAQVVIGFSLTVYGTGNQIRSYLNIEDTLQCVEIATLNPPDAGEFRVFNQFTEQFSILEIANKVKEAASYLDINVNISNIDNPRKEEEKHYYKAINTNLLSLGLEPNYLTNELLINLIKKVSINKDLININNILPKVKW